MEEGFGMKEPEDTANSTFDTTCATILLTAIKAHGTPRQTGITSAKPSTWARHFRLLRTKDGIPETDIARVLKWYAAHMGETYVPEAYSGAAFRSKFASIERKAARDITAIEISPDAKKVAARLTMLGWPAGCNGTLPAAVQTCLTGYTAWLGKRRLFVERLRHDDLAVDYGATRERLLRLGEHLTRTMPAPTHFVQKWMEDVHNRVRCWDGWGGDLGPLLFHPTAKGFRMMGRAWAESYAHDPDRWDLFCDVMGKELASEG